MKYIGVDGCRSGWMCAIIEEQTKFSISIYPTLTSLWKNHSDATRIFIDIPIGLRDSGSTPRKCDHLARKILTRARSSSIFPPPCRKALYATTYMDANRINRERTTKGLSKQAWNICDKIREMDQLLISDTSARPIFYESHPEVCFWAFNQGKPMEHYKKTQEGIQERKEVLQNLTSASFDLFSIQNHNIKNGKFESDDILDAWVLAFASSKSASQIKSLPNPPEYDRLDHPMRIVYAMR
ncbi:hypothetical protein NEF87_001638 [Candidatus Lokiarchaeum ossiferum]|uniref:DUF429 domain-containing protein n=1 Tax=Candidatus Lokiarchaeum ossiferum TaxID=2951803 RepID=A0ABY6HPA7_9ARCH|nr:hypothetical protein NEF87_001638 [Candidatus Lokiarchaeum sp. B-35]